MIAFITGSGFYERDGFSPSELPTRHGPAQFLLGTIGEQKVVILPRHGVGHAYLPHQINHRANLLALKELGVRAIVSCTVCGIIHPDWEIGTPLVAEDLSFPENRLGDGSTCTIFDQPGEPGRGHLLASSFFHSKLSENIRNFFESDGGKFFSGCYAHGNGPRFNSATEINAMRSIGADFLSQTCGPEAVLANELEIPYALAGFGVDFANGVKETPTPIEVLQTNLKRAKEVFTALIENLSRSGESFAFENFVYRFD